MKQRIILVNISTGNPDFLSIQTIKTISKSKMLVLRTSQSAIVPWLNQMKVSFLSLDDLYEQAEDFDRLSDSIAERLWSLACHSPVVYAVSDIITDTSVRALFRTRPAQATINTVPGTGLSDFYRTSVVHLLPDSDLRTVSSLDFLSSTFDPNCSILITELDNPILAGEIKIHLSTILEDEYKVFYLHDQDKPIQFSLFEIDRLPSYDHLSAILILRTDFLKRNRFVLHDLTMLMDRLRSPDGCPWDRIQTHQSLRPYLVEEAWECIAAIDEGDPDHLCEELGDLLFQVAFHASIGKSFDEFTITDIITSICTKMIRRHPHVFGDLHLTDPDAVRMEWEKIKRQETGCSTIISSLDDVSSSLPSLKYASKVLKKLNQTESFRRKTDTVATEIREILCHYCQASDSPDERECGRFLFLCAEYCSLLGFDSEIALRRFVDHFRKRLKSAEKLIIKDGKSLEHLTFEELGVYLKHVEGEIE